ncbi:hypothetical protein [Mesorhizobium silamurunense]|uniref:hypothetical protein n=1 Tax=Mesorhizobium silamurunense TaxID=499528 RepID=UPI00177E5456|nr:hypothetical protein [Mesorhizobium silamurunense]
MSDDVVLPGTGDTVAADEVASKKYQYVKPAWGPDDTINKVDTASGKALPVQVRSATGLIPIGEPTDAAATQTDTTSVSIVSILKQISKSIQLFVFGAGTAAAAQRVTLASDDPAVTAIGSTNSKLDTLHSDLATTLAGYVDGLEALVGTSNSSLSSILTALTSTIAGYVDGLETLVTSSNTKLDTIHSDLATTLSGLLTDLKGYTDQIEGYVDGLEALATSTNSKLDTLHTDLATLFPASLGTKTAANSLAVTLASDDAALASLGVMDDWDESDRAKVNPIVGQAGVAAGAGAVGATVQRVTLASDDPAVATLGATSGAAVITDANGTIQQYLRGLVKQWIAGTLVLGAGTNLIGKVKTKFIVAAAAAYTRPANTSGYTANDAVSNNATIGSVTAISLSLSDVNDDTVTLERIRIMSTDTGVAGKAFRVWLFNSDPTANSGVQGGDNAAWSQKQAGFIGSMSGTFRAFQDGSGAVCVPDEGSRIITTPVSGAKTIYALLQTLNDFSPSANSTTFTLTAEGFQGAA